jgi:ATP-dependent helicase/nuclease subunit A
MNWTKEQERAIGEPGNLIVSAAAGAGKTAVLTERVVRLVEGGMDIDRLLILTFTRAAAAEMKERIQNTLQQRAAQTTDEALKTRLYRQSARCSNASISTIHAFCARVVNRYFHLVGLSPSAATLDETESAVLRDQAVNEALIALATEDSPAFKRLIRAFEREDALKKALDSLTAFLMAQPDPAGWLDRAEKDLTDQSAYDRAVDICFREDKAAFEAALTDLVRLRDSYPPAWEKLIAYLDEAVPHARGALLQKTPAEYAQALSAVSFGRISWPKDMEQRDRDALDKARKKVKEEAAGQAETYGQDRDKLWRIHQQSARVLLAVTDLWRRQQTVYDRMKRDRDRIDFNDLEHFCAKILENDEAAAEYRDRFTAIIVDEYQDSNAVQEAILNRIKRDDDLFFVGDVKQSIYGFRMAEPGLFLEKLRTFTGEVGQRIDLSHNFRSSPEILDAANRVFEQLMRPGQSPIEYDEKAALRPGMDQPEGQVELHLIERKADGTAEETEDMETAEAEARFCARRIRELMETGTYQESVDSEPRPYRYDDFAILLRSMPNARVFARTLALAGIPCYAQLTGGYFESVEVMIMLNLLRVIDNRRQDIPLLSVLRSSVGDFSHQELIDLRTDHPRGDLLDCLLSAAEDDPACKAARFLERVEGWRRESMIASVEELLSHLLDETELYVEMGAMPGGAQRQANLDALASKARSYDLTGSFGLHGFLKYMDDARDSARLGASQTVEGDVVRILSVHKSKGLEFPVVFLSELNRQFSREGENAPLLLHRDMGMGLNFVDETGIKREPLSRRGVLLLNRRQQVEEEMRVLYVAMTRPKRRLILVGTVKNAREALDKPEASTPYSLLRARSYLAWLLMTLKQSVPAFVHAREEFALLAAEERPPLPEADPILVRAVASRYAYVYPFTGVAGVPNKTSVTALADRHTLTFAEPAFAEEEGALRRGTDVHELLRRLPLKPWTETELDAFLSARNGERYRAELDYFIRTDLFARLCRSPRVYRELPFTLAMDTDELLGIPSEERVLLQGVIDLCFREGDGFVLLDYKTDRVEGDPVPWAERHRRQVELYARALETLTGRPVREKHVVFLNGRACVRL